jgi:NADH:ubiquinone oxidoreductase subunit
LHPVKVGVWIAVSRRRLIGPIFFHETINATRYREQILEIFINQLDDEELQNGYFQHDGATAHKQYKRIWFIFNNFMAIELSVID